MKPKSTKVSSGYLTPQCKKTKSTTKRTNLSDREEENETPAINSQLVEALLQNPEKKKMILQLLALNKDVIEKHSNGSSLPSSVDKLKSKKICESPTALMRRRALEKMNGSPSTSNNNLLSRPHSNSSSSSSSTSLDKVLKGVKAYVEIRDRHNEDKSRGAKEILKSMGATVVDKLTREVTHVVFKDGSYKTFQMAKLLKVHIVSILWVEFSRKALQKANEKRFPAMGNEFEDETIVCSQMHKEYEDIIRDEYRKSILQGTPLPSTRALINRRRTLMTPSVTNNATDNSESSYKSAISSHKEIATITESLDKENLIMNDPEGFSFVDDENRASDMELTNIQNETPKRVYNNNMSSFDRRKTIGHSLCSNFTKTTAESNETAPQLRVSIDKLPAKFTKTTVESNETAPQLQVSIEKLQLTNQVVRSSSASSNDSEICLPSTKIQHKSRKSLWFRDANRRKTLALSQTLIEPTTETNRRRSLALDKLQLNSEQFQAKTAAKRRKTLAPKRQRSDSVNFTLDPSQTLLGSEELTADSSAGSLKQVKKAALDSRRRKHVTADSDSDNTDIDKSVTRIDLTSDSSAESLKRVRVKKAALKSRRFKKHVAADASSESDNTDIDKSVTRAELFTSDSSTNSLKQVKAKKSVLESQKLAKTRQLRPAKKISSTISDSDNSDSSPKPVKARRVAKPASKSQKLAINDKIKHVTGDSSDSMKSRRLYDPNTSVHLVDFDDEKERQEKREQNKKRRLEQAGFINPVTALFDNIAKNATENQESSPSPPKSNKKSPKKPQKKASANSSDDEQKQLLDEVLKRPKNLESRRKSVRILNSQSAKKATASKTAPSTQAKRRSTMDFMSRTQMSAKKKIDKGKLPTIVCTKLHRSEVQVFTQIVKKLGRFVVEDEVSYKTTHVVAGEAKRTLNMLRAIARGCWVLKHEWVLRSLEEGKWLPEENFELDDFSPAVRKCRLERQAFGANYTMDVFEACPPIYVALGTTPRCSDLRDLIRMCKGKVVTNPRMARIIVGQYVDKEHVCVTEKWVLDSVNFYEKMDFDDYLIEGRNKKKMSFAV